MNDNHFKHFKASMVKSALRLLAAGALLPYVPIAAVLLAGAELFGVIEELYA